MLICLIAAWLVAAAQAFVAYHIWSTRNDMGGLVGGLLIWYYLPIVLVYTVGAAFADRRFLLLFLGAPVAGIGALMLV